MYYIHSRFIINYMLNDYITCTNAIYKNFFLDYITCTNIMSKMFFLDFFQKMTMCSLPKRSSHSGEREKFGRKADVESRKKFNRSQERIRLPIPDFWS